MPPFKNIVNDYSKQFWQKHEHHFLILYSCFRFYLLYQILFRRCLRTSCYFLCIIHNILQIFLAEHFTIFLLTLIFLIHSVDINKLSWQFFWHYQYSVYHFGDVIAMFVLESHFEPISPFHVPKLKSSSNFFIFRNIFLLRNTHCGHQPQTCSAVAGAATGHQSREFRK